MRHVLTIALATVVIGLGTAATPAMADNTVTDGANCNILTPNPDAVACSGYFDKNLINSSQLTAQHDALANIGLGGDINNGTRVGSVFNWDTSLFANGTTDPATYDSNTHTLTFNAALNGITYLAIFFGNANGDSGVGGTVFYEFNFDSPTTQINLGQGGFSDVFVYGTSTPSVPEPATWGMMLLGFGGIGMAMRRGRKSLGLAQIA